MAQNVLTQIVIEALYKDKASGPAKEMEKQLQSTFSNVKKYFGMAFGAYSVKQLSDFALETSKLAGINTGVEKAYRKLSEAQGNNADLMLGKMKTAVNDTVDGMNLMQAANQAMLLKLPATAEDMQFLAEAGYKLGKAVGKDASYGLQSLIEGLGKGSRQMLGNLGIIVDTNQANKDYAISLGKNVDQLTAVEQKTAFYNAGIKQIRESIIKMGAVQVDANDLLEQSKVKALEAKIAFGQIFAPAVVSVTGAIAQLSKGISGALKDAFEVYKDESDRVFTANQNQYSQIIQIGSILDDYAKKEKLTADELKNRQTLIGQLKTIAPEYFGQLDAEKSKYAEIQSAIGRATDELIKKIRVEATQKALTDTYSKIIELQSERLKIIARQSQVEADMRNYWRDDQAALRLFNMTLKDFNSLSPGQQKLMIDNARASSLYDERVRQINASIENLSREIKYLIDLTPELKTFFDTLRTPPAPAAAAPVPSAPASAALPSGETAEAITTAESEKERIREQFRNRYIEAIQGQWSSLRENLENEVALYRQAGISETEIMRYYAAMRKQIATDELNYKAGTISQLIGSFSSLNTAMKGQAVLSKRLALISAIIDTFVAANKALASGTPPWNYIQMAAVIVTGMANVAAIQAQKFAEGAIFRSPVFSPLLQGGAIAGEAGPEAVLPLRNLPSLVNMSMSTNKIESKLDQLRTEIIGLNQNLSKMKFVVAINDKEIYAAHQKEAERLGRVRL